MSDGHAVHTFLLSSIGYGHMYMDILFMSDMITILLSKSLVYEERKLEKK